MHIKFLQEIILYLLEKVERQALSMMIKLLAYVE